MEPYRTKGKIKSLSMGDMRKVFIVDTDDNFRHILEAEVESVEGVGAFGFTSVEECLNVMEAEPEVIIVDMYMDSRLKNVMSGLDLLHHVKGNYPKTEVIILSSDESLLNARRIIEQSAFDVVPKISDSIPRIKTMLGIIFRHCDLEENAKMYRNSMYFMAASCFALLMSVGGFVAL